MVTHISSNLNEANENIVENVEYGLEDDNDYLTIKFIYGKIS